MRRAGDQEADARGQADAIIADDDRLFDELQDAVSKRLGHGRAWRRIADQNAELVGTEPGNIVPFSTRRAARQEPRPDPGADALGHGFEHIISGADAVETVDRPEIVEIDHER